MGKNNTINTTYPKVLPYAGEKTISKDSIAFEQFIKNYWSYYLRLEQEFLVTKRYVEFDSFNFKTYSLEYLKLYQAVCSEIDVVGKELAHQLNSNFDVDESNSNIYKWWFEIQDSLKKDNDGKRVDLIDIVVTFFECELDLHPWKDFRIQK